MAKKIDQKKTKDSLNPKTKKQTESSGKSKVSREKKKILEEKVNSYLYDKNTDVEDISKVSAEMAVKEETAAKAQEKTPPKKVKKPTTLRMKILKIFLKTIFIYVPATIIVIIGIVLVAAKMFLSPARVQKLAADNFNSLSNGALTLDVKEFDVYHGFIIENLRIANSKDFDNSDFVKIDRLVLKYGFFDILAGNIHFDEVGIYNPRITLQQKNGKWNFETLMKPTAPKEKEEEKKEPSEPTKEINLPISVQFLFRFILSNLNVSVDAETFKAELRDFSISTDIVVPPFKRVPLSPEAVSLFQTCSIKVNPGEKLNLYFNSKQAEVTPPLILTMNLFFDKMKQGEQPRFTSNLKIGTFDTPIRFNQAHLAPLNFMVSYDLFYEPISDMLNINSFGVSFNQDKLLNITGNIKNVSTKQEIDIAMTESKIDLSALYPYFREITGNGSLKFAGVISLMPLTVKGVPTKLDVNGGIIMSGINVAVPDFYLNMPKFLMNYTVLLRDDNAIISTDLSMPGFAYVLGREKSGSNTFYLGLKATASEGYKKFNIEDFNIKLVDNLSKLNALTMSMNGNVSTVDGTSGKITIPAIVVRVGALSNTLPESIRKSLSAVPLLKPVTLNLATSFELKPDATKADLGMGVVVPDFDVNDLQLSASILQDNVNQTVQIKDFDINSVKQGLNVNAYGWVGLKKQPISDSDLKLSVKINQPKMKQVFGPWNLSGNVNINAAMKGNLETGHASGNIDIKKLFVKNDKDKTYVDDLNLNFPFDYKFKSDFKGESKLALDKAKIITNENFKEKENFTIKSIRALHPARNEVVTYLSDLSSIMYFKDNTFNIVKLKISIFDGTFFMKDTFFYLADMKKENMQYKLHTDITNIDIGKLDAVSSTSKDAELSMNADLSGKGLNFNKEYTMSGYVNIYKIGNKFANRLMKGMSKKKGKSQIGTIPQFVVDNSLLIKNMNYYIDSGNVYTTVLFKKKALGWVATIQDEKIEFERISIQEYLKGMQQGE